VIVLSTRPQDRIDPGAAVEPIEASLVAVPDRGIAARQTDRCVQREIALRVLREQIGAQDLGEASVAFEHQDVVPGAAVQTVGAGATGKHVFAGFAAHHIVAGHAEQDIVAGTARKAVEADAAEDDIVVPVAGERIVARAAL
jgi:hypothetical protein